MEASVTLKVVMLGFYEYTLIQEIPNLLDIRQRRHPLLQLCEAVCWEMSGTRTFFCRIAASPARPSIMRPILCRRALANLSVVPYL